MSVRAASRLIDDTASALRLFAPLAVPGASRGEVAGFAYLGSKGRLVGMRHICSPRADSIGIAVRVIAADAIAFDARALVIAHSHPSGDPAPSAADIALTRRLLRVLDALEVRVLDHLVLTARGHVSFAERGLL